LINAWQTTPLLALNGLLRQMLACQAAMQRLEIQSARQIVAGGGGPPFDPRRSGSSVLQDNAPRRLVLRLQMTQARMRFLQALQHLQGMQGQLMHGQAQRRNRAQQFAATAQALSGQLQPQPTQAWHNQNQQHNNFLNALAALTHHPPPVQPTHNWQQLMQQHGNFLHAVQALTLNPPPAQPTQNWQNLVQQATNFQNALHALNANPPLPLMQGPIANNNNNAPMAYAVPHHNAQHILHGNHGGGQHMGMYNPALHGAPPNAITHHNFPGHFVTYFPVAWDAHDIITAVTEAAEATYHLAHQQANGNWLHPPVWVTRRGITIQIVVVSSVNWHGNLIVITAWPH
jgi:hypothetical protein